MSSSPTRVIISFKNRAYLKRVDGELAPFDANDPACQATSLGSSGSWSIEEPRANSDSLRIRIREAAVAPTGAVACDVARLRTGPVGGPRTSKFFRNITSHTFNLLIFHIGKKHVVRVKGCHYYQHNVRACRDAKLRADAASRPMYVKIHRADKERSRGAKRVLYKDENGEELVLGAVEKDYTRRVRAGTLARVMRFYEVKGDWYLQIEATILRP
mmetsp:Transcript_7255/g.13342  ORF Transcript_7255/g.13342 Transcript_7255/m.13342 type:complete len:215 (-) Transcript_7255:130-774(-)